MSYLFPKSERLKSRKTIDSLFKNRNGYMAYPLKVVWCKQEDAADALLQVAITVPKRNFKRAVDRNLIKRRIREAWRLNKSAFVVPTSEAPDQYALMLIYVAKETLTFQEIERGIKKAITGLSRSVL
jgi:ribonuclease P protein component